MKRLLLAVAVCAFGLLPNAEAQPLPCPPTLTSTANAGADTTICIGECATLSGSYVSTLTSTSSYSADTTAYLPAPYNQGTPVIVNLDDTWSGVIPLPFAFCFFGTKYNAVVIGSNGNVSFNTGLANTGNAFGVNNPIPFNYTSYNNCILSPFYDIDPRGGGVIRYATYGTAPCRTFVISYDNIGTFPCSPGSTAGCPFTATQQIVIYESTYVIDINIANKTFFTGSTSSGRATLGIQNNAATQAYSFPGRNNAQWSEQNKSYRFTPNGTPNTVLYEWTDLSTGTVVSNSQTATVCPTVTTNYLLKVSLITQCDTVEVFDNVTVTPVPGVTIDSVTSINPATCGGLGSITLHGLDPNETYTVKIDRNGAPMTPFVVNSGPGGSATILVPSGNYTNITADQGTCLSNTVGPVVLIDPPITAGFNYEIKWGCTEDTIVFDNFSATPGGLTHLWDFGDGTIDTARNPIKIYPNQGVYTVKLVVTNGECADSIQQSIDTEHPLVASFTQSADSFCQGGTVEFTNTSVTTIRNGIAPKYFWTFGDGGTDTVENPTYTFTRAGVWPVVLTVTDFVPCVDTAGSVVVIDSIPFVNFAATDSSLCQGQAVTFTGDFLALNNTGYVWDFGDGSLPITDRNPVTHGFDGAGIYDVTLTASYRLCNDTSFTLPVEIRPFTSISIEPDTSICPSGEPLQLFARLSDGSVVPGPGVPGGGGALVRWSTGDTASSILVRSEGEYWAVADLRGCTTSDSLVVAKDCYLDLPNAFTPNGDGTNDYFWPRQLLSEGITSFTMTVYNRWGQKVWETTRIDGRGWDGRYNGEVQPAGVYIYFVDAELKNGIHEKYQGNVTLLR